MYDDEYEYFKMELLKRKTCPYVFCNAPLAREFFKRFKTEVPNASYYEWEEIGQVICFDNRSRKRFLKSLEIYENKYKAAMVRLEKIAIDVQGDL